ncbi:unnamed protein product, partial [Onchocerca flexuosa]|uniref:Eukaryotic translation initiation factor 3 subunit p66 n=1 Tax=Onchocerca flexuosa TaxID=387005 RepID=A0A183HFD1_9BILA
FRYVSRLSIRNSASHVILGTQQYKPTEFATNITLNLDNAWGILRCIIDHCMNQPPGKYLLLKDPNKDKNDKSELSRYLYDLLMYDVALHHFDI